ncbi:MAG: alpha/beta fold hydrolase BchO [Pseudomonadota bacterium]
MSATYPDWTVEGRDWPNRAASAFVRSDGYDWHVQDMRRDGPVCLLIHGTGAATHSWRDLMPILARNWHVVAMDLPGHGFTRTASARPVSLPGMAGAIGALLQTLEVTPDLIVGHSAGAAIGAEFVLQRDGDTPLVGLNPALLPFPGPAARLFPQLAKLMFVNPFASRIFARMLRNPGEVERFLRRATGSRIDRAGRRHYQALLGRAGHCDGALRMMAGWDLEALQAALPGLRANVLLLHGEEDRAIPRSAVRRAADLIPDADMRALSGLGHLAHEEAPEQVAEIIAHFAAASDAANTTGETA